MKVIIKGTGQLNGPVIINKELDLDDNIARSLIGAKKKEILEDIMKNHYPDVKYKSNRYKFTNINIWNL